MIKKHQSARGKYLLLNKSRVQLIEATQHGYRYIINFNFSPLNFLMEITFPLDTTVSV